MYRACTVIANRADFHNTLVTHMCTEKGEGCPSIAMIAFPSGGGSVLSMTRNRWMNGTQHGYMNSEVYSLARAYVPMCSTLLLEGDVILTGYAIGGAVALAVAILVQLEKPHLGSFKIRDVVTFGQPKIIDEELGEHFARSSCTYTRIASVGDPVPWLPAFSSTHAPGRVIYTKNDTRVNLSGFTHWLNVLTVYGAKVRPPSTFYMPLKQSLCAVEPPSQSIEDRKSVV